MTLPNEQRESVAPDRTLVLVVEDDAAIREVLSHRLDHWGFDVRSAATAVEAEQSVLALHPDVVISDVVMPGLSGLDLLRSLKVGDPNRPVLLMSAYATIDMAVEAMREGALDFLTKPIEYARLEALLAEIQLDLTALHDTKRMSTTLEEDPNDFGDFVGRSQPMRQLYRLIRDVARVDAPALIVGESGTGKELTARTIHDMSQRAGGPFVAINAAAIPDELVESEIFGHEKGAFTGALQLRKGCFELAHGGDLLLDEIAEMPLHLQPKLLRVLEDRRIRRVGGSTELALDVRLLAATNKEPREEIQAGRLREDLFYRLSVLTIRLPPLRERPEDIPLLSRHFLEELGNKYGRRLRGFRPECQKLLDAHTWPGNVRELRNVIERAVVLGKGRWIEPSHLPRYMRKHRRGPAADPDVPRRGTSLADAERELIVRTLEQTKNNKAEAARRLGVSARTIRNKLKRFGRN